MLFVELVLASKQARLTVHLNRYVFSYLPPCPKCVICIEELVWCDVKKVLNDNSCILAQKALIMEGAWVVWVLKKQ